MPRGVDDRIGQAHAVGVELRDEVRHDPFVVLLEGVRFGKEGSGMTILAHSEEEKIVPVKALTSGAPSQLSLIFLGSDWWICLAPDPKNVLCGDGGVIKERFLRHPIVTLVAVGRNTSLIAETKNPLMPSVSVAGELAINGPWGVPSAQAKMKLTALENGDVGFSLNKRNGISDEVG